MITSLLLDKDDYDASDLDGLQLVESYSRNYTLIYDPHSNAKHRSFVASHLFSAVTELFDRELPGLSKVIQSAML